MRDVYNGPIANLFILTGENEYLLLREKLRWIEEFTRKHGPENLVRLEGAAGTVRTLLDEVSVLPFLASKRLVLVDGMVRCSKEEAHTLHRSIHPDVLLLFADSKPDKRSGGIKELLALAGKNVTTFPLLKGSSLSRWVEAVAAERGGRLEPRARDLLIDWNGGDAGMIVRDLEKLLLLAGTRPVTVADVERVCVPTDEGIVWTITDYLAAGKRREALTYARRMLARGSDPHGLWAMLLSFLRNAVAVRAALDARIASGDIAGAVGIHPFALRSLLGYCKQLDADALHALLRWASQQDVYLKTGAYRATKEEQQEIQCLIDTFLCKAP